MQGSLEGKWSEKVKSVPVNLEIVVKCGAVLTKLFDYVHMYILGEN